MTSDIAGAPAPQPAPQAYDPIRAQLRAGKNDEAIVRLCAIVVTRPDDLNAKELLFDAFFQNAIGRPRWRWPRSWCGGGRTWRACTKRSSPRCPT